VNVTVLDAPSNLGLRPGPGGRISEVDRLAATVRAAGLLDSLRDAVAGTVTDAGVVEAPAYDLRDWRAGEPFNGGRIHDFTIELADRLEPLLSAGSATHVLGADCSILLGPLLALRDEDVVMIGLREPEDVPFHQATGAADALARLTADDLWVHVDADILDPSHLPAVDSPEPGGLTPDQLVDLLHELLADRRVRGVDLCIYDPGLDSPDLPGAALLADILARAFTP
jgi:arginase